jgi:hypothetical protein
MTNKIKAKATKQSLGWIYGQHLTFEFDKAYKSDYVVLDDGSKWEVNSETICYQTGISDVEGNMIYNHDDLTNGNTHDTIRVEWNATSASYMTQIIEFSTDDELDFLMNWSENLGKGYYTRKDLKVIGNKFDNI